ncbi:hypothetical protein [Helicobacter labetoulli]|uniref:hypothetical protein n=1 Tax=Helicobacter labetoulli TaxID=2315333 RepID=UPI00142DF5F4|nr:hypothetical protein [Helicobacter labetoulli]
MPINGKISVTFRQSNDKNLYCLYGNNGFEKTSFIRCAKLLFLGTGLNETLMIICYH